MAIIEDFTLEIKWHVFFLVYLWACIEPESQQIYTSHKCQQPPDEKFASFISAFTLCITRAHYAECIHV